MKFSIITITYNSEEYLEETLQSVASQDFDNYEHIIWDGGSCDNTLKIAQSFPHLKIFQGKDEGISDAMNLGAQQATGDYLLHLHSDDLLVNNQILGHLNCFLRQHPEAKWLYGQADIINEEGKKLRTTPFIPFSKKRLRKYNIITHPSTLISRKLFLQHNGFDKTIRYCMDYDLWLRLAESCDAYSLPFVISQFREHQGSLSTRETLAVADEAYLIRNKHVKGLWERYRSYRTWKKRRASNLRV